MTAPERLLGGIADVQLSGQPRLDDVPSDPDNGGMGPTRSEEKDTVLIGSIDTTT